MYDSLIWCLTGFFFLDKDCFEILCNVKGRRSGKIRIDEDVLPTLEFPDWSNNNNRLGVKQNIFILSVRY